MSAQNARTRLGSLHITIDAPIRFGENTPEAAMVAFRREQGAAMAHLNTHGPADIRHPRFQAMEMATYLRGAAAALENGALLEHVVLRDDCWEKAGVSTEGRGGPASAKRVGIESNYCPATPGQLVEPAVYDLESGAGAGYPGGPDPKAIYMAVSQTEAVVVPPEVGLWIHAYAAGQQAIAAHSRA